MISEDSYIYICMFWIVLMISDVLWHCSHFSGWWFLIPRVQEKSTPGPWGLQGCAAATWGSHCGLHLGAVAEYPRSKSGWTDFWLKIFKIDNHVLFWIQFHQLKLYGGDFSKKTPCLDTLPLFHRHDMGTTGALYGCWLCKSGIAAKVLLGVQVTARQRRVFRW